MTTKIKKLSTLSALSCLLALGLSTQAVAQEKTITLCWAAWDPANALIELSKDYEAQSGNTMTNGAANSARIASKSNSVCISAA